MKLFKYKTYNLFIQLSSGAIGDFVMMMDMAIRAHHASGADTLIIVKNNASFLKTFLARYPYITVLPYTSKTFLRVVALAYVKRTCILWETANIGYRRRVLWFLKFFYYFTPTRVVALQVRGEFSFLGHDAIDFLNDRKIYLIGVQMLRHVGLFVNEHPPAIQFVEDLQILASHGLSSLGYIVVCPTTSGFSEIQRSWPDRRWARLISETLSANPSLAVVFIGGKGDKDRFLSIVRHMDARQSSKIVMFDGTLDAQHMMTIFSNAKVFFGVRTGTTAVASCISMKGDIIQLDARPTETIWYYGYNTRIHFFINLLECKCRPMNFVRCYVRDKEDHLLYHRCNYFIDDNEVIRAAKMLVARG